jgi:hypothetical protein
MKESQILKISSFLKILKLGAINKRIILYFSNYFQIMLPYKIQIKRALSLKYS